MLRPDHGLADPGLAGPGQRARGGCVRGYLHRCVNTGRPVSEVVARQFSVVRAVYRQLADCSGPTPRAAARHLLDFDDLLLLWQAALADPVAGPVLRGMFDAVLVDEYQDVNAVQASIVRLLQPDGKQLTCVGDDAQAIYGFRGADPAHLRQLVADYPGLEIVRLDRNYRSRQGILDLANLIRPSAPGLDLRLIGDRGPGPFGESGSRRCWSAATTTLPSDMALGDPGGLAEEHRLFYVAITRARDHLYLYAPQRLHYHRRGRDDRHGFGQLTRFLHPEALAACDSTTAAPLSPALPASALSPSRSTRPSAPCGMAEAGI